MTDRENLLKVVHFDTPDHIPMHFHINGACWHHYPQDRLQDLMEAHPLLFPDFKRQPEPIEPNFAPEARAGNRFTDPWGCVWESTDDGIVGTVVEHPLASWDDFADFTPPDPKTHSSRGPRNWERELARIAAVKERGGLTRGGLVHGHTFLTLSYIRGYENLLFDMFDGEPRLWELIEMVEEFNMFAIRRYVEAGVEWMSYPEDLGMQVGPMLSVEHFQTYIKPSYERLMAPARDAGCIVHMHSDGDIRDLVDDLIDGGVEIVNLQDLVNGIDWIAEHLAGKVCIDLDIDRQDITPFGTPQQVDALIRESVEKLGSKKGGLMMIYGMYPGVPLANAEALMDAMEKYSHYHSQ